MRMVLLSGAVLLGILEALGSIPGPKREKKQRKVSLLFMLHKNTAIGSLTPASPLLSLALLGSSLPHSLPLSLHVVMAGLYFSTLSLCLPFSKLSSILKNNYNNKKKTNKKLLLYVIPKLSAKQLRER